MGNMILAVASQTSSILIPATTENFVAKENFSNDVIKISFMGRNFKEWFLSKVESPFPGGLVYGYRLNKSLFNEKLAGITLFEFFNIIKRQANGEIGSLFINGRVNVFYVYDIGNTLRTIKIFWYDGGWYIRAFPLESPKDNRVGSQVFSNENLS